MPTVDYREIFEKAEVGIALNDPEEGTVGMVNQRYAEMVGYSKDRLETMAIEEISADDPSFDQSAAMERIRLALEGEPQRFDWLFERQDGSRFWGEVALKRTTIGDEDRLLAFVRDISDRKAYERELEGMNQRLEEFAGLVSHDLKNPLTVAMGRLELAREDCDSEHLEPIGAAHGRMERLIDDMLALARSGDSIGELESVDLGALAAQCWTTVDAGAADLVVDADGTISADRSRLQQVLENLMQNAVDHGGDAVTVRVGDLPDGFFVEDDGTGIPPDERHRVLEPGYSRAMNGTGFGLSIVRDIAEAHDWSIDITEADGGGARIEITGVDRA